MEEYSIIIFVGKFGPTPQLKKVLLIPLRIFLDLRGTYGCNLGNLRCWNERNRQPWVFENVVYGGNKVKLVSPPIGMIRGDGGGPCESV